jgi:hypothetical protein
VVEVVAKLPLHRARTRLHLRRKGNRSLAITIRWTIQIGDMLSGMSSPLLLRRVLLMDFIMTLEISPYQLESMLPDTQQPRSNLGPIILLIKTL